MDAQYRDIVLGTGSVVQEQPGVRATTSSENHGGGKFVDLSADFGFHMRRNFEGKRVMLNCSGCNKIRVCASSVHSGVLPESRWRASLQSLSSLAD